jgi:hypothetical protein
MKKMLITLACCFLYSKVMCQDLRNFNKSIYIKSKASPSSPRYMLLYSDIPEIGWFGEIAVYDSARGKTYVFDWLGNKIESNYVSYANGVKLLETTFYYGRINSCVKFFNAQGKINFQVTMDELEKDVIIKNAVSFGEKNTIIYDFAGRYPVALDEYDSDRNRVFYFSKGEYFVGEKHYSCCSVYYQKVPNEYVLRLEKMHKHASLEAEKCTKIIEQEIKELEEISRALIDFEN